jgi:hypothetical protein
MKAEGIAKALGGRKAGGGWMARCPLVRQHFSVSRSAEYFRAAELQAQTGQPVDEFAHVALKELVDNTLDAVETAGVAPLIQIEFEETEDEIVLTVADNGLGIPANVVGSILDFTTRTSDKAAYRAPTRGQQGNALKTVLGIPVALGAGKSRLTIVGAGTRHEIAAWITPAGEGKTEHVKDIGPEGGARISITMPRDGLDWNPALWAFRSALFNPDAAIQIRGISAADAGFKQAKFRDFWGFVIFTVRSLPRRTVAEVSPNGSNARELVLVARIFGVSSPQGRSRSFRPAR